MDVVTLVQVAAVGVAVVVFIVRMDRRSAEEHKMLIRLVDEQGKESRESHQRLIVAANVLAERLAGMRRE